MPESRCTFFCLWHLTGAMFVAWSLAADRCATAGETVALHWSGATECYEFDTGELFGAIQPYSWYHGVAGLVHRQNKVDVVRPRNALLNAEYYLRPGSGPLMKPRELSSAKKTTHRLVDGTVILQFPPEPDYAFQMQLEYWPHGDSIDMQMTVAPSERHTGFRDFLRLLRDRGVQPDLGSPDRQRRIRTVDEARQSGACGAACSVSHAIETS